MSVQSVRTIKRKHWFWISFRSKWQIFVNVKDEGKRKIVGEVVRRLHFWPAPRGLPGVEVSSVYSLKLKKHNAFMSTITTYHPVSSPITHKHSNYPSESLCPSIFSERKRHNSIFGRWLSVNKDVRRPGGQHEDFQNNAPQARLKKSYSGYRFAFSSVAGVSYLTIMHNTICRKPQTQHFPPQPHCSL